MVQFLSIIFFSWISSIFVGFFKSSRFFMSLCITSSLEAGIINGLREHKRTILQNIKHIINKYNAWENLAERKTTCD